VGFAELICSFAVPKLERKGSCATVPKNCEEAKRTGELSPVIEAVTEELHP
jgi:hypothetical protein